MDQNDKQWSVNLSHTWTLWLSSCQLQRYCAPPLFFLCCTRFSGKFCPEIEMFEDTIKSLWNLLFALKLLKGILALTGRGEGKGQYHHASRCSFISWKRILILILYFNQGFVPDRKFNRLQNSCFKYCTETKVAQLLL